MLGNIGDNTCFCLYGNALWMYAMMLVKYQSVWLWNRVAVGKILLFFSYFGVEFLQSNLYITALYIAVTLCITVTAQLPKNYPLYLLLS